MDPKPVDIDQLPYYTPGLEALGERGVDIEDVLTTSLDLYSVKPTMMYVTPTMYTAAQRLMNPYPPPKNCGCVKQDLIEAARKYFGWAIMNGADLEALKQDAYWRYMED